jgi:G patch domain-containing protein 1
MGMYGPLTRTREPFYPTRLLCKRFNVKAPANVTVDSRSAAPGEEAGVVDANKRLDVVSQASLDRMMREASWKMPAFTSGGVEGGDLPPAPQPKVQHAAVDVEKNKALEGQKAGEAVFKAIFGGDDEDD